MLGDKEVYLESIEKSIIIQREAYSCIFGVSWSGLDLDRNIFLNKIYKTLEISIDDVKLNCAVCGRNLSTGYVYIIYMLKRAGLLDKSFVSECCFCYLFNCIGLYIPNHWINVIISESMANSKELTLLFITGYDEEEEEEFELDISIYDMELALKTGRILYDVGM